MKFQNSWFKNTYGQFLNHEPLKRLHVFLVVKYRPVRKKKHTRKIQLTERNSSYLFTEAYNVVTSFTSRRTNYPHIWVNCTSQSKYFDEIERKNDDKILEKFRASFILLKETETYEILMSAFEFDNILFFFVFKQNTHCVLLRRRHQHYY